MYLRFVLYETQKKNVSIGYVITRLAPVGDDEKKKAELNRILKYIDPCIELEDSLSEETSDMANWYRKTFGVPGTPEFEENVKKMNEKLHNNG